MRETSVSVVFNFSIYEKDNSGAEEKYRRISINKIHRAPEILDFVVEIDGETLIFRANTSVCAYDEKECHYTYTGCGIKLSDKSYIPDVLSAKYLSRIKRICSIKTLIEYKGEIEDADGLNGGKYIMKLSNLSFFNEKSQKQYEVHWDALRKHNEMQYKKEDRE